MNKSKKHITFIDQYAVMGGGQTVLLQLIQVFLNQNYSVSVLAPTGGELEQRLRSEFGQTIQLHSLKELKLNQGSKSLFDFVKIGLSPSLLIPHLPQLKRSSLVYVNGGRFFAAWWLLNKALKIPTVYHVHLNHSKIEKKLIWKIAQDSRSLIICISKFVFTELTRGHSEPKNIKTVENALSKKFSQAKFQFRKPNKTSTESSNQFNVAVIGRISPEKGQELICRIASQLSHINFYLIGSSDFANAQYAQDLIAKAPKNVIALGKVANIGEALDKHNIQFSIVPSRWEEPFGLTAIESMALSCVTIVSDRGELPNIANKTGALVFSTEQELVTTLKNLTTQNSSELESLAKKQFDQTISQYQFDRFSSEILRAISEK